MRVGIARVMGVAVLLGVAAGGTGCSTLTRGSHQTVTFKADAADARVFVGEETLALPATVELSRKKTYTVLVMAPGRQTVQFEMKPKFDGISLGNLIYPGGSIGLLTDFVTGADKKFTKVEEIEMPLAATSDDRTLVLMRPYKGKLMTKQEIQAVEAGEVAEVATERVGPTGG